MAAVRQDEGLRVVVKSLHHQVAIYRNPDPQ